MAIVNRMIRDKFYILGYLPEDTLKQDNKWEDGVNLFGNILNNKNDNENFIKNIPKKDGTDVYIVRDGRLTDASPTPQPSEQPLHFMFKYGKGSPLKGGANPLVGGEKSKYNSINKEIIMDKEGELYFVVELIGVGDAKIPSNKTMARILKLNSVNGKPGWEPKSIEAKKLAIKHNRGGFRSDGGAHDFLILQPNPSSVVEVLEQRKQNSAFTQHNIWDRLVAAAAARRERLVQQQGQPQGQGQEQLATPKYHQIKRWLAF